MKKSLTLALVVPLVAVAAVAVARTNPNTPPVPDKATLQAVLDAWGTRDAKNPAKYYAQDAGLAFYDIAPLKYTGFSEYTAGVTEFFKTIKSLSFKVNDDAQIHTHGNLAWTTSTVHLEMQPNEGAMQAMDGRWTTIWEKRGNQWLIVHDHFSAPMPE